MLYFSLAVDNWFSFHIYCGSMLNILSLVNLIYERGMSHLQSGIGEGFCSASTVYSLKTENQREKCASFYGIL